MTQEWSRTKLGVMTFSSTGFGIIRSAIDRYENLNSRSTSCVPYFLYFVVGSCLVPRFKDNTDEERGV